MRYDGNYQKTIYLQILKNFTQKIKRTKTKALLCEKDLEVCDK